MLPTKKNKQKDKTWQILKTKLSLMTSVWLGLWKSSTAQAEGQEIPVLIATAAVTVLAANSWVFVLKYTSDDVSKRRANLPIPQTDAAQHPQPEPQGHTVGAGTPGCKAAAPWTGEVSADCSPGSRGTQLPSTRLANAITNHLAVHQEDQIQISVQKIKRQV